MTDAEKKKKDDRVRKARLFFRQLASKNYGWDGVKEIRKWRDKDNTKYQGKESI